MQKLTEVKRCKMRSLSLDSEQANTSCYVCQFTVNDALLLAQNNRSLPITEVIGSHGDPGCQNVVKQRLQQCKLCLTAFLQRGAAHRNHWFLQ